MWGVDRSQRKEEEKGKEKKGKKEGRNGEREIFLGNAGEGGETWCRPALGRRVWKEKIQKEKEETPKEGRSPKIMSDESFTQATEIFGIVHQEWWAVNKDHKSEKKNERTREANVNKEADKNSQRLDQGKGGKKWDV